MRHPDCYAMQLRMDHAHQSHIHKAQGLGVYAEHRQVDSTIRTPATLGNQKLNRQFRVLQNHVTLRSAMPRDESEIIEQFHHVNLRAEL